MRTAVSTPASRRAARARMIRVFFACWLIYTVLWAPFIVREHYPAVTLVEQGTLNVSRYFGWTDDIFRGPHGGAFINNNPGASLTGAIPLLPFRPLLTRVDAWNQTQPRPAVQTDSDEGFWHAVMAGRGVYFLLVGFLTVAFLMAPLTAGMVAYLGARLIQAGFAPGAAAGVALLTGLGTPLLFRSGLLNHNLLVADAGFIALLILWDPRNRPVTGLRALLAGLLSGYAVLCDYSGSVVVVTAGIYVLLRWRGEGGSWRVPAAFAVGLVPGCAALLLYQAWAFGPFYLPSQQFMTPTAPTSHGYRGFGWPSPALAWALLVDPRFGIFAYCPALAAALAAPFMRTAKFLIWRREMWILLGYFALFLVFCAANQYSWLQPLTGFRYLVPVVPGLALLAIYTALSLPRSARVVVMAASCLQSILMTAAHENDLRLTLSTLWQRKFEMLWAVRLREAGIPDVWSRVSEIAAALFVVIAVMQVANALRTSSGTIEGPSTMTVGLE